MNFRNLVIINGEARELNTLSEEEYKRQVDKWNRNAAEAVNYKESEEKTA